MPSEVKLSVRQEMFILFILKGEAQSRAYRLAGYKASNDDVAEVAASKLLSSASTPASLSCVRRSKYERL